MIELMISAYQMTIHSTAEVIKGINEIFNNPIDSAGKVFTILVIFAMFIALLYLLIKIIQKIWLAPPD